MVCSTKLYDLLEVRSDATQSEIKRAYHKKALDCHPDKETDPVKKTEKEAIFKEISEAYGVLSDERKRQIYDQTGSKDSGDGPQINPADLFANLFGGGNMPFGMGMNGESMNNGSPFESFFAPRSGTRARSTVPPPVNKLVTVSLKDIYCGTSKIVEVDLQATCHDCQGKGCMNEKDVETCQLCNGKGIKTEIKRMGPMVSQMTRPCMTCGGQGKKISEDAKCETCRGDRIVQKTKKFKITMDPTTGDNTKIVYPEKGNQHPDAKVDGDLNFIIRVVEDSNFKRRGNDLHVIIKIPLEQALLGKNVEFHHLDGRTIELIWAADDESNVLDPNRSYRVRKEGIGNEHNKGDLIVKFMVEYPKQLDVDQRTRLESVFSLKSSEPTYDIEKRNLEPL